MLLLLGPGVILSRYGKCLLSFSYRLRLFFVVLFSRLCSFALELSHELEENA